MSSVNFKLTLLTALLLSCAPRIPADYAGHQAAAEAAISRRDHAGAAREWAKAAEVAGNETDRQEALYRQATSSLRAGDALEHQRILTSLAATPGPRQERAVFDLATTLFARDPASGSAALRAAVLRYPASGLARGALQRWLDTLSPAERVVTLEELLRQLSDPQLRERVLLLLARSHETTGNPEEALRLYQQQVREFPYPHGRYWDESLLRQSVLWLTKGNVSRAVDTLEVMLSFRERATVVGSYERQYAEATLLLAYVLVDDRWQQARSLLSAFPAQHPDSRYQDDALWAALLLAHSHGQSEAACEHAETLISKFAESRYAPCSHHYCPRAKAEGECKGYVLEERDTPRATLEAALVRTLATPK